VSNFTIPITDGQTNVVVPGPLHDGDTATFHVNAVVQPFDVDYSPATLTWAGLKAEMKANPGKRIGLGASHKGGYGLTSIFEPDPDTSFDILQLCPITSKVDAAPGAFYFRRPHGRWSGLNLAGPITLAQIAGKANANEQHHGYRQDGGDIELDKPVVLGFWGDAITYRAWGTANGGDGKPPFVALSDAYTAVAGRCGVSVIVGSGSITAAQTDRTGAWGIDVETNTGTDKAGPLTISGGNIGTHGIGANPGWTTGGIISAIQLAGGKSSQPIGPITLSGITAEQFDIVASHVGDLTLANLTSSKPAKLILENVGAVHKSGLVNIQ